MASEKSNDSKRLIVYGAGSLRKVMGRIANAFFLKTTFPVKTEFGPSGWLREKIEGGERPDLFASADMKHPMKLNQAGLSDSPLIFARNEIGVLVRENRNINTENLLEQLLGQDLKIGAPEPIRDPGGDYVLEFYKNAEILMPGSFQILEKKTVKLWGDPSTQKNRNAGQAIANCFKQGMIDVFVGYISILREIVRDINDLEIIHMPNNQKILAEFGLTVLRDAKQSAFQLAYFILSSTGQQMLSEHGFEPVTLPYRKYDS